MSKLFSPFQVGALSLSNRIVVPPMCQYSAIDGVVQPWHTAHYGQLALGGASLVVVEATGVEPIGRISPFCLGLYTDVQEGAFAQMIESIRSFTDTPLGIQIAHAGRKASARPNFDRRRGPVPVEDGGWRGAAPSAIAFAEDWAVPDALDEAGLERVKDAFVQSAVRACRAGFDYIELHFAHGYLLSSFLSPLSNTRDDLYGGSLENRMRFPLEIVAAVRAAIPAGKALAVRMNGADWHADAFEVSDAVTVSAAMRDAGADCMVMSGGLVTPEANIPQETPGYMVEFADAVRNGADVSTMAVGMILFAQQAEEILEKGQADLIGIARGFLDDPRWACHAAYVLGAEPRFAKQYSRAQPARWRGYQAVHG